MLATTAREAAVRFGARVVVDAPDGRLTYAELDAAADRLAEALTGLGVGLGDPVAIVLPSGGDWMVAAVAVDRVGGVVCGISPRLAPGERAALVELVRPALVLASPDLLDGLPLRTPVAVVAPGTRGGELADDVAGPPPHDDGARPSYLADAVLDDPERTALVCCTSGTTGRPKGATFRVAQLRAVAEIDLGPDWATRWDGGAPMLASTEFAHVGMVGKFPWYLRLGCTLVVMARWRADDALRLVAHHRMPTVGVVAPQLALMLRSPVADEVDLGAVTTVIAGGAPSPPGLVHAARARLGCHYSVRYSSTESGGVGLATPVGTDEDPRSATTVGRPRPGVAVRVVDEDGRPLGPGAVGELQLRSGAVMDGYWNDPAATAATLDPDGWLRTGDLATVDDDGWVTLAGRRTEMFIRGGYNVFPAEVEAVLGLLDGVAAVAVVPRDDEVLGEVGVAVVVPTDPDHPPTLEALRSAAAERLARHKLPEDLLTVAQLPLTTAQKLDRAHLRRLVADVAPTGPRGRDTAEDPGGVLQRDRPSADGVG